MLTHRFRRRLRGRGRSALPILTLVGLSAGMLALSGTGQPARSTPAGLWCEPPTTAAAGRARPLLVPAAFTAPGGPEQRSAQRAVDTPTEGGALTGDEARRVDELLQGAEADQMRGHYRRAVAALRTALDMAEAADDRYRIAAVSGSLGVAYLATGARAEARSALERSLEAARDGGFPAIEAVTLNNLGNLLAAEERESASALDAYDGAVRLALETDQPALATRASINAARLLARKGNHGAAEQRVRAALDQLERAPSSADRAIELVSAGLSLREIGGRASAGSGAPDGGEEATLLAHSLFNRAATVAAARGDARAESYALGYLGALYADEGRTDEALRLTRRALFLAQTVDAPEALYRWQWQAGRLLAAEGQRDAAITAYDGAIETLQSIRNDLPAFDPETGRSLFRETVGPVFLEFADLLLQRAAETGGRAAQPDLVWARSTVEQLKTAELEDYFRDDCVALLQSRITPIDRLADRSAALYPIILPDRLELLVSLPDGLVRATVPVPGDVLQEQARQFREAIVTFQNPLRMARQLHQWLIEPIEDELTARDIDTLIFVPDGALRLIPLTALFDGEQFVVMRYAVATAPGLSLLDPRPIARTEIRPLLAGLTEAVQGFDPLPQVDEELRMIEQIYGGTVLKNEEFVASELREALDEIPYTIVHVASHAQFASNPEDTFLLTYNGRLGIDALEQLIRPSRFRDEPVELIALSACETAAGDDRAALGLAGVAIKAGARSAFATLWQVADEAASRVAAEFYRQLGNPELSKAQALQRAQLTLLQDQTYVHPFFWAPFLLIGNWL